MLRFSPAPIARTAWAVLPRDRNACRADEIRRRSHLQFVAGHGHRYVRIIAERRVKDMVARVAVRRDQLQQQARAGCHALRAVDRLPLQSLIGGE